MESSGREADWEVPRGARRGGGAALTVAPGHSTSWGSGSAPAARSVSGLEQRFYFPREDTSKVVLAHAVEARGMRTRKGVLISKDNIGDPQHRVFLPR